MHAVEETPATWRCGLGDGVEGDEYIRVADFEVKNAQVHFGVKVELITFMQRFMTACIDCPDLIRTDARLAANVALHARLADQRRWIRTVDRDRMVARRKLREGGRAHAEFLAATYARDPFASGSARW